MQTPKLVTKAQYLWRRYVQLPYWISRCSWRVFNGRWSTIGEAPLWFIRWCKLSKIASNNELKIMLRCAAIDELRLRQVQEKRLNNLER